MVRNQIIVLPENNYEVDYILTVVLCMKDVCYLKEMWQHTTQKKKVIKNGCKKLKRILKKKTNFLTLSQTINYLTVISSSSLKVHQKSNMMFHVKCQVIIVASNK